MITQKAIAEYRAPVLLAEDDENNILLLEWAFEKVQLPAPLKVVRNGQQAIDYLNGDGPYADRARFPFPALLLLDLQMPVRDGFEVLNWRAGQPQLRSLPVIVLSSSVSASDIKNALALGATAYRVKPLGLASLVSIGHELRTWLEAVP
jgi:CheY-like chemotaxis protein